jgi:hypothetical protein
VWWLRRPDVVPSRAPENTKRVPCSGIVYLPAVARRLHHCRDLHEPFDFLTWFEYPPEYSAAFEELVVRLRTYQGMEIRRSVDRSSIGSLLDHEWTRIERIERRSEANTSGQWKGERIEWLFSLKHGPLFPVVLGLTRCIALI